MLILTNTFIVQISNFLNQFTKLIHFIQKHPDYNGQSSNLVNDLALLELAQSVTVSNDVSVVCVNEMIDLNVGSRMIVVGWGQIDESLAGEVDLLF